ncbi:MAG: DUF3987 domain-containing protein [Clostridiales bacterium]|jgi:hypothetical protein|nr:DUF3987 domain-containing protein [Clostridiales bacterium]
MSNNFLNIPAEMRDTPHWIVWRLEMKPDKSGELKLSKTPYSVNGGDGKVNDAATWASFTDALATYEKGKYNGLGFVFTDTPFVAVDIDGCYDPGTKTYRELALDIANRLDSYTERSQSGRGLHIICRGQLPEGRRRNGNVEMYSAASKRYFAMTGHISGSPVPIRECQADIDFIHKKYIQPVETKAPAIKPRLGQRSADYNADMQFLQIGLEKDSVLSSLWAGNRRSNDESANDIALVNKLAYWCNGNESLIESAFYDSPHYIDKDESHLKKCERPDYIQRTIQRAVKDLNTTARDDNGRYKNEQARREFAEPTRESKIASIQQADTPPEWEPPIPFDNVTVPAFPVECFPPQLKDYVLAVSEATQTPVDMAAVASLADIAVCVQGKYKVQAKPDWTEPLNLYVAIVANPAERKSAVLGHMARPLYEYEQIYNEASMPEINQSRLEKKMLEKELEALTNEFVKKGGSKAGVLAKQDELTNFKEKKPLRLLADDVSPEALTSLLADNGGNMSVISSEGGIFEILAGRYSSSVNIDTFLKSHCGDPIRIDRKGRESEYIPEPCLTTLLCIQPQVLDGIMSNDVFRGRGLTARFLYCIPQSALGNRRFEVDNIPQGHKKRFRQQCFDLLDIKKEKETEIITLSPEAYSLTAEYANQLEPLLVDELEGMSDFAGKLHGAVLRIAGLLHVVEQNGFANVEPMKGETMSNAIKIGDYFLAHAKAAYQLMGADEAMKDAKYILAKLEKERFERVTKRDFLRLCRKFKKTEQLDEPLKRLIEYNYLKELNKSTSGNNRVLESYIINPLIYDLV